MTKEELAGRAFLVLDLCSCRTTYVQEKRRERKRKFSFLIADKLVCVFFLAQEIEEFFLVLQKNKMCLDLSQPFLKVKNQLKNGKG